MLEKDGLCYPTYGAVSHAHHLLSPHAPKHVAKHCQFKPVAEWAQALRKTSLDKVLLSSELIAWTSRDAVIESCRAVQEHFSVTMIIYVRLQDNMVMASYNQRVKAGWQKSDIENVWQNNLVRFNYWKIIDPWATGLGKVNVVVLPYQKQQFYQGDIRYDFIYRVFGIEKNGGYAMPSENPNLCPTALAILYKLILYKVLSDSGQVSVFDDALLAYSLASERSGQSIFSNQSLLSQARRSDVIRRSSAINDFIAREYLSREEGLLFHDTPPDVNGDWTRPSLTPDDAEVITEYFLNFDPRLEKLLSHKNLEERGAGNAANRETVESPEALVPVSAIGGVERRSARSYLRPRRCSQSPQPTDKPHLLISLHLSVVTVNGYLSCVDANCRDSIVGDYGDRPMSSSSSS